jgi:transposase
MYFRIKKTPSGQTLQLIEAYRNSLGYSRSRTVISLGNANIPKESWKAIAKAVENKLYDIYYEVDYLFDLEHSQTEQMWIDKIIRYIDLKGGWKPNIKQNIKPAKQIEELFTNDEAETPEQKIEIVDGVEIENIEHCNDTGLGAELAGLSAWNELEMEKFLKSLGFNSKQCACAAVSVINRLIKPLSEHALEQWIPTTSFPELLGSEILQGGYDPYYRVSDKLLKFKDQIKQHLINKESAYFKLERTVLLYDLTNTYFEGTALENPKAKRGCSKHKRNDCPQIVVGMVFDNNGFEVGHKIFEGNRNDATTVTDMLSELKRAIKKTDDILLDELKPLVILDGGIATKKNLQLLKAEGFSYLVNDSRRGRTKYKDDFLADEKTFKSVSNRGHKTEVLVKLISDPFNEKNETNDNIVLCKSAARRDKEYAIRSKMEERFIAGLEKIQVSVEKGTAKTPEVIERRVGKLQKQFSRAAKYYNIELIKANGKNKLTWTLDDEKYETDDELFGCYVIRTDRKEYNETEIWNLYMTLTKAEDGFRMLKSNLGIRPNFHRIEDRVDAHVFVTVLAYHMLHFIMYKFKQRNDHRSWPTIRRILSTHSYSTITVPTNLNQIHRIRKAGLPDEAQKDIYRCLGIDWKSLPKSHVVLNYMKK